MSESTGGGEPISRRDFLKGVTGLAAAAVIPRGLPGDMEISQKPSLKAEQPPPKEPEKLPEVLFLDIFDIQQFREKALKQLLSEGELVEEIFEQMGVEDFTTQEGLKKALPQNEKQEKLLLLQGAVNRYLGHGKEVMKVEEAASKQLFDKPAGIRSEASIGSTIRTGGIVYDSLGNPIMPVTISVELVDKLVSESKADVINMSIELGRFQVIFDEYCMVNKYPDEAAFMPQENNGVYIDYHGKPITKEKYQELMARAKAREKILKEPRDREIIFIDGYEKEETFNNLSMLAAMAKRYPDKIFIAAGGNPSRISRAAIPDIRQAREDLTADNLWPDNLLMVGWIWQGNGASGLASLGDDIYVKPEDIRNLGFTECASFATPIVTAVVQEIMDKGVRDPKKIKEILQTKMSNPDDGYVKNKICYVLDFDKVKKWSPE